MPDDIHESTDADESPSSADRAVEILRGAPVKQCDCCGGAPATRPTLLITCDDCAGVAQAAYAALVDPAIVSEHAAEQSLQQRGAVARGRMMAHSVLEALWRASDVDNPDAGAEQFLDTLYAFAKGHKPEFAARHRLIDAVEEASRLIKRGVPEDAAIQHAARGYATVWPEHAQRVDAEQFRTAVRECSQRGKWKAVLALLQAADLYPRGVKSGAQRKVEREHNRWRKAGGRYVQSARWRRLLLNRMRARS
jgi:hypothetical protein